VSIFGELDLRAIAAAELHAQRIRRLDHDQLGVDTKDAGGIRDRNGVIAGTDRGDAAGALRPRSSAAG